MVENGGKILENSEVQARFSVPKDLKEFSNMRGLWSPPAKSQACFPPVFFWHSHLTIILQ